MSFKKYLEKEASGGTLSVATKKKYYSVVTRHLKKEYGIDPEELSLGELNELKIKINKEKYNEIGHNMYSSALSHYINYKTFA